MADRSQIVSHVMRQFGYEMTPEDTIAAKDEVTEAILAEFARRGKPMPSEAEIAEAVRTIYEVKTDDEALKILSHPNKRLDLARRSLYGLVREKLPPNKAFLFVREAMFDEAALERFLEGQVEVEDE